MFQNLKVGLIIIATVFFYHRSSSQTSLVSRDTVVGGRPAGERITLLVYTRGISDAKGNKRADENIVGNFKLGKWLRLEAGIRQGERPHHPDSYFHYKLELQSKYFWKTARLLARITDNILTAPAPPYRKTIKLVAAEARYPLSRLLILFGGAGYVFSSQQNNHPDFLPTSKGVQLNYPVFRISLRYKSNEKGFVELAYGSYDVFNPYYYNSPFAQILTEQELSKRCAFFSYFRYQYSNNTFTPENYFLCAGLRFHFNDNRNASEIKSALPQ